MLRWRFVSTALLLLSFFHYILLLIVEVPLVEYFLDFIFLLNRLTGTSGPCDTFGNQCLAHSPEFELKNIEVDFLPLTFVL